jgi:hypothetical protein
MIRANSTPAGAIGARDSFEQNGFASVSSLPIANCERRNNSSHLSDLKTPRFCEVWQCRATLEDQTSDRNTDAATVVSTAGNLSIFITNIPIKQMTHQAA